MDSNDVSSGGLASPIIPKDWAVSQLKAHWPNLEIEAILPTTCRQQFHVKASLPEVGKIGIRMLAADPQDPQSTQRLTTAFHRAQAMAAVENPHAISTLQAGSMGNCLVIVSKWVDGTPLPEHNKREKIGFASALEMIDCLAQAFETYHQAGWLHGHLRADSVLVTGPNEVKLSGHGIIDILTGYVPDPLDPNRVYVSPERNGSETDPPTVVADVYTVGVVAYEILTGEKPVGQFMKLPSQVTGAGAWLDDVILRAIHPKPGSRIQTLTDFRREMAAQSLKLMDLNKESEEPSPRKQPKEISGTTAMLRKSFYAFTVFALLVTGVALWFGQTMYENQAATKLTAEQTMALMGELIGSLSDGEGNPDLAAIIGELANGDPEMQAAVLLEKVAALKKQGRHEEAMALTEKLIDIHGGSKSPGMDAMKNMLAELGKSLKGQQQLKQDADQALARNDLSAEEAALEKLFQESPEDPVLKRRLSQIPKYFTPTWEHVETELKRWNPEQKEWHITTYRDEDGLEVDISGHDKLFWVDGLKDLPIDRLDLRHTRVTSIGALSAMPLRALWCDYTEVDTINAVTTHPIETLSLTHTKINDFGLIERLPFLKTLRVPPTAKVSPRLPQPTRERTWENSLGMRFLPARGSSLLIETREVTELDYAQHVVDTKAGELAEGIDAELKSKATLTPILVTLPQALAFCQWLTAKELQADYLPEGAVYRLPEPKDLAQLLTYTSTVTVEDGAQSILANTARPVAMGPCLRGFFDVPDNAPEWEFGFRDEQLYNLRKDLPKGVTAQTQRGIRLVLDLSEARYKEKEKEKPIVATDTTAEESSDSTE